MGGPPNLSDDLWRQLDQLELRWSRFVADSDVSRANARQGRPTVVSPETLLLVQRAIEASRRSAGWFDPLLLHELSGAGYDRSFELLQPAGDLVAIPVGNAGDRTLVVHSWDARTRLLRFDHSASTITVPAGFGFDPGGIGKGLAGDLLVASAIDRGAMSVMVDLGGDIVFGGAPPRGGWPVQLEDPFQPWRTLGTARLDGGAIATSSIARRRWLTADGTAHHLIDPTTGRVAGTELVAVTVIAGDGWMADALANAALVAGLERGREMLAVCGVEAVLVDRAGRVHGTSGVGPTRTAGPA